jgi:hypothetical protein
LDLQISSRAQTIKGYLLMGLITNALSPTIQKSCQEMEQGAHQAKNNNFEEEVRAY